jgi:hypothetical protein
MMQVVLGDNKTEEFLMRLGVELYQSSFRLSERLVMPGFPWIPGQPVVRYKADSQTQKSVLYQAGFGVFQDFIKERSLTSFLSLLGVSMNLPSALTAVATSEEARSIYWKTVLPVPTGSVTVSVGDGTVNNQFGIVLDTIVVTDAPTAPSVDEIMKTLDSAHEITNRFFVKLTEPIHDLMQPRGA